MKNTIYIKYHKTPYGELVLGSYENQLCLCDWQNRKQRDLIDNRIKKTLNADFIELETNIISKTIRQLNEYFKGERKEFDLALNLIGSDFQKKIWGLLTKIPYGKTETYLSLSQKYGNEKAIRAVANANGANAVSIIVPCHRIIGSNGEMVGYAGGVTTKKRLLNLERSNTSIEKQLTFDF